MTNDELKQRWLDGEIDDETYKMLKGKRGLDAANEEQEKKNQLERQRTNAYRMSGEFQKKMGILGGRVSPLSSALNKLK